MIHRLLLSTALIAFSSASFAADLPARVAAPAPYLAAPIFTWTGFYVGLNAGAGLNASRNSSVTTNLNTAVNPIYVGPGHDSGDTQFTGGAQVGYNMQFGSFVAGVEADINYLHRSGGSNGVFPTPANRTGGYDNWADFAVSNGRSDWFGTLRGRLGYAFDRFLVYGTGGLAFSSRMSHSVSQREVFETTELVNFGPSGSFVTNPERGLPGSSNNNTVGWALGAGGEYAFTNAMSLKLEYLHVDLGNKSQNFTTLTSAASATGAAPGAVMTAGNTISVRDKNQFDLIRAGVNVRF